MTGGSLIVFFFIHFIPVRIIIFLALVFFHIVGYSQVKIKVVDERNLPVPFATVAWNTTNGIVATEDGLVTIPKFRDIDDSVLVTSIGYKDKKLYQRDIKGDVINIVKMETSFYQMPEVIAGAKSKISKIGYSGKRPRCYVVNFMEDRSMEAGVKIAGYERGAFLEEIQVYIEKASSGRLPFRLKLYQPQNNYPGISILNNNVVIESYRTGAWHKIPLGRFNIQLPDNGVFVGVEWLITHKSKGFLAIGADDWSNNENRYERIGNTGFFKLAEQRKPRLNSCIITIKMVTRSAK